MFATPRAKPNKRVGPKATPIVFRSAGSSASAMTISILRVYLSSNSLTAENAVENWAAATNPEPISSGPLIMICQTNRNAMSRPQRCRP
jgi:hypothetical protein